MAQAQLLARAPEVGGGDLELVKADLGRSVQTLAMVEKIAPGRPILFGTESLLVLASMLRDVGFVATHLELTDTSFRAHPAEGEEVQETALDLLRNESIDDVLSFFRNQGRGFYVVAVELRSPSGWRFAIKRNGWITIYRSSALDEVAEILRTMSKKAGIV